MMCRGREIDLSGIAMLYTKVSLAVRLLKTSFVSHQKWSNAGGLIRRFLTNQRSTTTAR